MNKRILARFEKRLIEDKARVMSSVELSNTKREIVLSPDELADEVDQASQDLNQSIAIRLRGRERLLLKKIEDALKRIREGTFGHCDSCEEPIETRRLEARPVATLCIQCKEEQEQHERVFA